MALVSNDIDNIYLSLCKMLTQKSSKVSNTYERNAVMIQLTDIRNNIVSIRNLSPAYLAGELLWYYTGRNDLEFISKFSSFWKNISDNGLTCNSAYGYLMQGGYGFNQIALIIKMLQKDPNSRRAVINLNVPNPKAITTKDEPCTIALQFFIRNKKLHCIAMMRSNDIWFGFPYDVAFFTDVQKYIARHLGIEYGTYYHFAVSLHLYDRDFEKIMNIVQNPIKKKIYLDHMKFQSLIPEAEELVLHSDSAKYDLVEFLKEKGAMKIEDN